LFLIVVKSVNRRYYRAGISCAEEKAPELVWSFMSIGLEDAVPSNAMVYIIKQIYYPGQPYLHGYPGKNAKYLQQAVVCRSKDAYPEEVEPEKKPPYCIAAAGFLRPLGAV
jgi:hypothetical protein